jgi:nitrilase
MLTNDSLKIAIAQIAPMWLNRGATIEKMVAWVEQSAESNCNLIVFGEALIPGYPFWVKRTGGARFNDATQKAIYSYYAKEAVQIEAGHLDPLCAAAKKHQIAIYTGTIERAADRGSHSLYCSLVYIDATGVIQSVHRKLMPTYEERLVWSTGDGNGLRTHKLGAFTVGGLNCWENWMPLPRAALYGLGEDLHVAVWPGGLHNTHDITRFIAKESRSFVISASGLMRREDISADIPHFDLIRDALPDMPANGGSCIAAPDGTWIVEPVVGEERLIVATIDHARVREERHNFDPAGHYSRPDVTQLSVNRTRQSTIKLID